MSGGYGADPGRPGRMMGRGKGSGDKYGTCSHVKGWAGVGRCAGMIRGGEAHR